MRCECCGGTGVRLKQGPIFACECADMLFCRTCNRCEQHCQCGLTKQVLDVPMSEQLAVAKYEAERAGVRL